MRSSRRRLPALRRAGGRQGGGAGALFFPSSLEESCPAGSRGPAGCAPPYGCERGSHRAANHCTSSLPGNGMMLPMEGPYDSSSPPLRALCYRAAASLVLSCPASAGLDRDQRTFFVRRDRPWRRRDRRNRPPEHRRTAAGEAVRPGVRCHPPTDGRYGAKSACYLRAYRIYSW